METNNINIKFNITGVFVRSYDEFTNVIEKVTWKAKISRNEISSLAEGEVFMDPPETLENFTPIEEISEQQLIDWILIRQGGDVFVENLKAGHIPYLDRLELESKLTRWSSPLIGQEQDELQILTDYDIDDMIKNIKNA